jgi:hypothetical protein
MKAEISFFAFSVPKMSAIPFLLFALCAIFGSAFPCGATPWKQCSLRWRRPILWRTTYLSGCSLHGQAWHVGRTCETGARSRDPIQDIPMKREGEREIRTARLSRGKIRPCSRPKPFSKPSPLSKIGAKCHRVEAEAAAATEATEQESKSPDDEPSDSLDGVL